jgi:hypothetical protein
VIQPRPIGTIYRGNCFLVTEDCFVVTIKGYGTWRFKKGWWFEASIPRFFWWILGITPTTEWVLIAGCIHDWEFCVQIRSEKEANKLWDIITELDEGPKVSRSILSWGLRKFSHVAWVSVSVEDKEEAERLGSFTPEC